MTLAFVPPLLFPAYAQTVEEKLAGWLVGLNPVYWAVWLACLPPLITGKWLHGIFGQDGPVRADESDAEHQMRVQWIYLSEALFFAKFALDMRNVYLHVEHDVGSWEHAEPLCRTAGIGGLMLGAVLVGNEALFQAMRTRCADLVRVAIAGNLASAVVMAALLSRRSNALYASWSSSRRLDFAVEAEFVLHAVSVIFAIMCLPLYGKLWNAYSIRGNQEWSLLDLAQALTPFSVLLALAAHAYVNETSIVWQAFT